MYDELYIAWQREITDPSLGDLPSNFYIRIAEYMKKIDEENNIPDKKTLKVSLLEHEEQNVKRMLEELVWARYKKLLAIITQDQKAPAELLSAEEAKMVESFVSFAEAYQNFAKSLFQGQISSVSSAEAAPAFVHKRATLRFTKNIPSIVGADMKMYGPFLAEDVASVPVENAKILVKQGLAVTVEVS